MTDTISRSSGQFHATSGRHPDWLPGLTLSWAPRVTEPLSDVTRPVLALIAQGAKRTVLADRVYDYEAGQYLIATVDLPLSAQVTRATDAKPFLALGLPLKAHLIADLLLETEITEVAGSGGPGRARRRGRRRRG